MSAFYFAEGNLFGAIARLFPEEGDWLELTSIGYYEQGIGRIAWNEMPQAGKSTARFAQFSLEIWHAWLLIEASNVSVGGVVLSISGVSGNGSRFGQPFDT